MTWTRHTGPGGVRQIRELKGGRLGRVVCEVGPAGDPKVETRARLIEATPELILIALAYVELAEWATSGTRSVTAPPDLPGLPDTLTFAKLVLAKAGAFA